MNNQLLKALCYFHPVSEVREKLLNPCIESNIYQKKDPKFDCFDVQCLQKLSTKIVTSGYTSCLRILPTDCLNMKLQTLYKFHIPRDNYCINDILLNVKTNEQMDISKVYDIIQSIEFICGGNPMVEYSGDFLKIIKFVENCEKKNDIKKTGKNFAFRLSLGFQNVPIIGCQYHDMKIHVSLNKNVIDDLFLNCVVTNIESLTEQNQFKNVGYESLAINITEGFQTNEKIMFQSNDHHIKNYEYEFDKQGRILREIIIDAGNNINENDLLYFSIKDGNEILFTMDFKTIRQKMKYKYNYETSKIYIYNFSETSTLIDLYERPNVLIINHRNKLVLTITTSNYINNIKVWMITGNINRMMSGMIGQAYSF